MADQPSIYLTQADLDRLFDLVETYGVGANAARVKQLERELVRAVVVPRDEIPSDIVTMNSRVEFEDETTGERREITLVYPKQADIDRNKVSVLVPVGTALLGVRIGQSIDWDMPSGAKHRFKVVAIPFQGDPSATSDTKR